MRKFLSVLQRLHSVLPDPLPCIVLPSHSLGHDALLRFPLLANIIRPVTRLACTISRYIRRTTAHPLRRKSLAGYISFEYFPLDYQVDWSISGQKI